MVNMLSVAVFVLLIVILGLAALLAWRYIKKL
jgi:hypothetical protein